MYNPEKRITFTSCNVKLNESVLYKDCKLNKIECEPSDDPEAKSLFNVGYEEVQNEVESQRIEDEKNDNNEDKESVCSDISEYTVILDDDWNDDHVSENTDMFVGKVDRIKTEELFSGIVSTYDSEPLTYRQALASPDRENGRAAIDEELNSIYKNKVWTIVPRTSEMQAIPTKWVFKKKDANVFKARLVAIGCNDKESYESVDIYAPVAS